MINQSDIEYSLLKLGFKREEEYLNPIDKYVDKLINKSKRLKYILEMTNLSILTPHKYYTGYYIIDESNYKVKINSSVVSYHMYTILIFDNNGIVPKLEIIDSKTKDIGDKVREIISKYIDLSIVKKNQRKDKINKLNNLI